MATKHWEGVVVPPAAKLADLYPVKAAPRSKEIPKWLPWSGSAPMLFSAIRKDHKQLSSNHWAVGVNARLLWAAAYGADADYETAKIAVESYLRAELDDIGLWQGEQFTGAPHGGFHLLACFCGLLGSTWRKDEPLHARQLEQFRRILLYLAAAADMTGETICCGERMPTGPAAPQQSAVWREGQDIRHPNAAKIAAQIADDFWSPFRAFRKLVAVDKEAKAIAARRTPPKSLPFVAQPVQIEKWDGGHRAFYMGGKGDGTCPWVWTHLGTLRYGGAASVVPAAPRPVYAVLKTSEH